MVKSPCTHQNKEEIKWCWEVWGEIEGGSRGLAERVEGKRIEDKSKQKGEERWVIMKGWMKKRKLNIKKNKWKNEKKRIDECKETGRK